MSVLFSIILNPLSVSLLIVIVELFCVSTPTLSWATFSEPLNIYTWNVHLKLSPRFTDWLLFPLLPVMFHDCLTSHYSFWTSRLYLGEVWLYEYPNRLNVWFTLCDIAVLVILMKLIWLFVRFNASL